MFDNLVGGAVLAIVGGLGFVAYRHPKTYRRVQWAVIALFFSMCLLFQAYYMGVRRAMSVFYAPSPPLAVKAMNTLVQHSEGIQTLTYCGVGITIVAIGLGYLPKLLDLKENKKVKDE